MCLCVAVDLRKDSSAAVYHGQPRHSMKPDCTVTVSDGDFVDMATGKLDGSKVHHWCFVIFRDTWWHNFD